MRKVLDLGKVDYLGNGRKTCLVTLEIELRQKEKGLELSICGNVWNNLKSDIYNGGQNYDTIAQLFPRNKKVQRIVEVWKKYHLNGMHAGTPKQEAYVEDWKTSNRYDYTEACEALKAVGLYEDNGYKYGTSWLFEEIPQDVIDEIKSW